MSALAIERKLASCGFETDHINRIAYFIDCNCLKTDRVAGGPKCWWEDGANAARWDPLIQRAIYNGWKSIHGLKHQTVDNDFGFTVDMFGPTSLRRNDLVLLRESDINNRLAAVKVNDIVQFITFGDSAYKRRSHLTSYVVAPPDDILDIILSCFEQSDEKAENKYRMEICFHLCAV